MKEILLIWKQSVHALNIAFVLVLHTTYRHIVQNSSVQRPQLNLPTEYETRVTGLLAYAVSLAKN